MLAKGPTQDGAKEGLSLGIPFFSQNPGFDGKGPSVKGVNGQWAPTSTLWTTLRDCIEPRIQFGALINP